MLPDKRKQGEEVATQMEDIMKKLLAVVLLACMSLSLLACGREKVDVKGPDDLAAALTGVQLGTTGDIYVSDFGEDHIERFNKGYEAVQALLQGKVDAVVIDDQPAKTFVAENKGLKILEEEFALEEYAIAISKDNAKLKEDINAALKEIKANGTFDRIVDYYIGQEQDTPAYTKKDVDRSNGTLVMATNAEFPPYEYSKSDKVTGLDVDMMLAVCDILGMELVIEDMQFDSIIASVISGKADVGVAGLTVTEDRLKSVDFSDTYYTGKQVIIVAE